MLILYIREVGFSQIVIICEFFYYILSDLCNSPNVIKNIPKRERAGEWEVRRPRFTLGAKFILCGDKIYL